MERSLTRVRNNSVVGEACHVSLEECLRKRMEMYSEGLALSTRLKKNISTKALTNNMVKTD